MKIRHLDLEDKTISQAHMRSGLPPVEYDVTHAADHPIIRICVYFVVATLSALTLYFIYRLFFGNNLRAGHEIVLTALQDPVFWSSVAVGLIAQTVDGALGMAYGITASSFLMASGASPALASGATHLAEVFTTGVSGVSHLKMGNVNKKLFLNLLVPGIIGGLIGAYLLKTIDGAQIKPWVSAYLLVMGLYVFSKAFRTIRKRAENSPEKVIPLALFGSFVDTTGGGGWGPIVTTSLIGSGRDPRTTIGSVNFAEFFLTITVAAAFFTILDESVWLMVAGLVAGGLFAAPLAAYLTKRLKARSLLMIVGSLISVISGFNLYVALIQ
jgi:uncharacterized protein